MVQLPSASQLQVNVVRRATYTVPEVAGLLGISRATAYAMLRQGEIPARQIGSRWIIPRRRFDAWLDGDLEDAR